MVALTAEIAEAWEPIFFYPEKLHEVWGRHWRKARPSAIPDLGPLEIIVRAPLAVIDGDPTPWIEAAKPQLALYVGGMGSREKNFYNRLVSAYGFAKKPPSSRTTSWPAVSPRLLRRCRTSWSAPHH